MRLNFIILSADSSDFPLNSAPRDPHGPSLGLNFISAEAQISPFKLSLGSHHGPFVGLNFLTLYISPLAALQSFESSLLMQRSLKKIIFTYNSTNTTLQI